MPDISRLTPYALAALRIIAGLLFFEHGLSKLFGVPPGPVPMPEIYTIVWWAGALELVLGALVTLGLATRPAAFLASGQMAVAYWMFHAPHGFYPLANRGELAILYCFIFLFLAFAGGGKLSAGALIQRQSPAS